MKNKNSPQKIVVVGAGISGLTVALTLAESGKDIILVDKAYTAGGLLPMLDHQFPNNHCGMCRALPMIEREAAQDFCLKDGIFHDRIAFYPSTRIEKVEGAVGDLTVTLASKSTGIDRSLCTGCGACLTVCPENKDDGGLRPKAIYIPKVHRSFNIPIIDKAFCVQCGECKAICPEHAIDLAALTAGRETKKVMPQVSAVILSSGGALYDPKNVDLYGMKTMPNVVTAITFERMISSRGPNEGALKRPSDGRVPEKIAWIQCVGSRNLMQGSPTCSSACCMFAVKEAVMAKEKTNGQTDTAIFYMDMRTFGRDFQRYRDAAENEKGVRFERCRIHSIEPADDGHDLVISYVAQNGAQKKEIFNLVVLSTGKNETAESLTELKALARQDGVFLLESAKSFRDIADAVKGALATVSEVTGIIKELSFSDEPEATNFKTIDPSLFEQKPKILLLIQTKGLFENILDWDALTQKSQDLHDRVIVQTVSRVDEASIEKCLDLIRTERINRVLAAAVHPAMHLPTKPSLARQLGMPVEYIRMIDLFSSMKANNGEQEVMNCILARISEGIAFLKRAGRKPGKSVAIKKKALVIGAGPAGLAAAKSFADAGLETVVVEKKERPGMRIDDIHTSGTREKLDALLNEVSKNSLIEILTSAELIDHAGQPGDFTAEIAMKSGAIQKIEHGAVVIATGGHMAEPISFEYGKDKRILRVQELQKKIQADELNLDQLRCIVMIQCVDSRQEPRNYCSRMCCLKSIETAIAIKEKQADISVMIFYRDIMTYGANEQKYTEARKKGILFIPFAPDNKPEVRIKEGQLTVCADDPLSGVRLTLSPDLVGLAAGLVPGPVATESSVSVASLFNIDTNADGFILEADYKWRPVDTGKEGIFVCGLARAPGAADEALEDGRAAAARAIRILGQTTIGASFATAKVKHALCSRCGLCIEVCPFSARYVDEKTGNVMVDPVSCQGCGTCAVECPNSATQIFGFEEGAIMEALEGMIEWI